MPSLAEFQRGFVAAVFDGAISHGATDREAAAIRVHRNTIVKALVDALLANYPTVGVLMGVEWLAGMAREYALQNPPRQAALAGYGDDFPAFLRTLDAARTWPYLAGVADLDRAWTRSFLAADAPPLDLVRLAAASPDWLGSLRLQLHPATQFGVYSASAATVWRANRPPATPPASLQLHGAEEAALILRSHEGVVLVQLDAAGRAFIEAIISGATLSGATVAAMQLVADKPIPDLWCTLLQQGAFANTDIQGD